MWPGKDRSVESVSKFREIPMEMIHGEFVQETDPGHRPAHREES